MGFVWKVVHKRSADESLLIGYEYTHDLLGRVVQSVERRPDDPGTDTTVYAYTPAGRLESEVREGQVWYRRYYKYNLDGSRHTVERDDMLNGEHVDVYAYDPVSGRLASVQDALTGEVHSFVWNPEGTLARYVAPLTDYEYTYNEDGFVVEERVAGVNRLVVTRNSDGRHVHKAQYYHLELFREFYFVYSVGCAYPLRTYMREGERIWWSVDLRDGFGRIASRERFGERFGDNTGGHSSQQYIIWAHYGLSEVLSLTNASGAVLSSGSSREHCENLKDKLLSLVPDGAICKRRNSFILCPMPPVDCKEFNDTLYRFCYNCKAYSDFALDCDMFANWYYLHSGCKNPPLGELFPGRPFLPPVRPGDPVAPLPSQPRPLPIPICDGKCDQPVITSPDTPRRPPCPKCSPLAHYIWINKIEDNPISCAKFANGLRAGFFGRILCDECCNKAAEFYGWSFGKKMDCHHACSFTDPFDW